MNNKSKLFTKFKDFSPEEIDKAIEVLTSLKNSKKQKPIEQFLEIISKTPDATLLTYGLMDGGFYTTTGIIPNCKAFCSLNVRLNELEELQNK